jgi:hypothetical protein
MLGQGKFCYASLVQVRSRLSRTIIVGHFRRGLARIGHVKPR